MVAAAVALRQRPRAQLHVAHALLCRAVTAAAATQATTTEPARRPRPLSMHHHHAATERTRPPPATLPLRLSGWPTQLLPAWSPLSCAGQRCYLSSSAAATPPTPSSSRQPSPPDGQPAQERDPASSSPPTPSSEPDVADTAPSSPAAPSTSSSSAPTAPCHSSSSPSSSSSSSTRSASLPSAAESRRSRLSARFSRFMDEFQDRVLVASQALNDLTGYSAIEQIKARNAELETQLSAAQADLRAARRAYQAVNERRAATQREVTTLLARKDSWVPADLERFTALYRADHELETGAQRAVDALQEAEATEARLSAELTAGMLKRYHEEQVWSDRIRRQSTWGTWGLMAVNVLLFLLLQLVAEPWRRARLMRSIAEAESGALAEVRQDVADVRAAVALVTAAATANAKAAERPAEETTAPAEALPAAGPDARAAAAAVAPAGPSLAQALRARSWPAIQAAAAADVVRWRAWALDLSSERPVSLRMRDLSLLAVQSAAAGALVVGSVVFAVRGQ